MVAVLTPADRRRKVWSLVLRGVPETVIAQSLGVHRNTIVNDLRKLREEHRSDMAEADALEELGDAVAKFDDIFRHAIQEFHLADSPGVKRGYLSEAANAVEKKVRLLLEVGVLPRAAQEVKGNLVVEGVNLERANLEELRALRDRLVQRVPPEVLKKALERAGRN